MKKISLYEENLPQKLPVSFSAKIRNNINLIKDFNQNNLEALYQWYDYLDNLKSYISNPVIAWDYANRYSHLPNGAIHLVELGYDTTFIVSIDRTRNINYVYVFKLNLKLEEFGLKIPPNLQENKIRYIINTMKTNKKVIRLTESDLHCLIEEAVRETLNEGFGYNLKEPYFKLINAIDEFTDILQREYDIKDNEIKNIINSLDMTKDCVDEFVRHPEGMINSKIWQ